MRGRVKWFSREKGFGFITDESGVDRHFAVRDVVGALLPVEGASVSFNPTDGKKGPRATQIQIVSQGNTARNSSQTTQRADDRVTCASCGKKMVPRIITYRGEVQRSVCPFCAETHKDYGCLSVIAVIVAIPPIGLGIISMI